MNQVSYSGATDYPSGNGIPVSRERAEYVAKVGKYDRCQAMQDLRDANRVKWLYRAGRRVFDIAFSGAVIALGLIPGAIICAAICLESPGWPHLRAETHLAYAPRRAHA